MTCRFLGAAWAGSEPARSRLWSAETLLMLAGLVLFALLVEKRTQNLHVQIFVRLNLIFILVATSLVLAATHAERKQLLEFEELHWAWLLYDDAEVAANQQSRRAVASPV